jgi:hypothetical protein
LKERFASFGKELRNRFPGASLDLLVAVDIGPTQPLGQEPANGTFSRTHHADQQDSLS